MPIVLLIVLPIVLPILLPIVLPIELPIELPIGLPIVLPIVLPLVLPMSFPIKLSFDLLIEFSSLHVIALCFACFWKFFECAYVGFSNLFASLMLQVRCGSQVELQQAIFEVQVLLA